MISAEQLRQALDILKWTHETLVKESGVPISALHSLEQDENIYNSKVIRQTLEHKGIQFHGRHGVSYQTGETIIAVIVPANLF